MPAPYSNILSRAAALDFGTVDLCPGRRALHGALNQAVTDLCRSLPPSMQAPSLLFLMEYSGIALGAPLDFFRGYYAPCWTVLHWICPDRAVPDEAARAHAMAMLLHSLDDHLNDGYLAPSHTALLVRSQAWRLMMDAIESLAKDTRGTAADALGHVDEYYRAITAEDAHKDLESYLKAFASQMATGLVAPRLLAGAQGLSSRAADGLMESFRQFGAAWRLMDDLRDIKDDRAAGTRSALYYALPADRRDSWLAGDMPCAPGDGSLLHDTILSIVSATIEVLEHGAGAATGAGFSGYAGELMELAAPLRVFLR